MREQIALVSTARGFISVRGAGQAHVLWMRPDAWWINIVHPTDTTWYPFASNLPHLGYIKVLANTQMYNKGPKDEFIECRFKCIDNWTDWSVSENTVINTVSILNY